MQILQELAQVELADRQQYRTFHATRVTVGMPLAERLEVIKVEAGVLDAHVQTFHDQDIPL